MNAEDISKILCLHVCLVGAHIQSLRQQDEGQQQFHGVRQVRRKRKRRMRKPKSMWVSEWLSADRRQ